MRLPQSLFLVMRSGKSGHTRRKRRARPSHVSAVLPTRDGRSPYTGGLRFLHEGFEFPTRDLVVSQSPALRFLGGVGMSSVLWLTPPHANTPECPFSAVRGQGIHGAPKFPAEHRGLYKTAALKSSAAKKRLWRDKSVLQASIW